MREEKEKSKSGWEGREGKDTRIKLRLCRRRSINKSKGGTKEFIKPPNYNQQRND